MQPFPQHPKEAMSMMTRMVRNKDMAQASIRQGTVDQVIRLPGERSSEVASFILAIAESSEENADLLVEVPGVLNSIAGLIKKGEPNGVLVAKKIAGYIWSSARDAIRENDEIVVGLCEAGVQNSATSEDAMDALADLALNNARVQTTSGEYLSAFVDRVTDSDSALRVIASVVDKHYENQMKFIDVLAGDDERVVRLLSKKNGVSCVRAAIHHRRKNSTQRTRLCKIDALRKIVIEKCNANDGAFKDVLRALCSGHSGNYSRFVADGFKFTDDLNIKASYKRKEDVDQEAPEETNALHENAKAPEETKAAKALHENAKAPEEMSTKTPVEVRENKRLKCENKMLREEIEFMRGRFVSTVCQQI